MANTSSFKVPTMVAQDLAMIMELVDPPQAEVQLIQKSKVLERNRGQSGVSKYDINFEDDIASSGTESEDEVEAEIAIIHGAGAAAANPEDSEDSDASSVSRDSSTPSLRQDQKKGSRRSAAIDIDLDEDGPAPVAYVPSTHELPPTAIPLPPLPDPSTLPLDPLQYVGELVTVLQDTVIVRGAGPSGVGHLTARERRDAVLDEGSLLLFDDRTMLGYVWETFGPTALPHYVVRINRVDGSTEVKPHISPAPQVEASDPVNVQASAQKSGNPSDALLSANHRPDPAKLKISTPVYHIPSLSNFVFAGALARLKGSDASNVHDEEPAEHELEFSDDEAEAAHKRLRNRSSSRAPSSVPQGEDDAMSAIGDDASSLYGQSPYDDISSQPTNSHDAPTSSGSGMDFPMTFEDPAVRDALMLARNSRSRRPSSASISDISHIAGPSQLPDASSRNRGRGRGRGRGNDRPRTERVRDHGARGNTPSRARGRGRGQAHAHAVGPAQGQDQGSSFSFDEYDPHMPRPPSPTSLAIARVTGQWNDGTPFPYQVGVPGMHAQQPPSPIQSFVGHTPAQYQLHGYYDPTFHLSQTHGQHPGAPPYAVAPHINPRFAQAFGFPGTAPISPTVSSPTDQSSVLNFPPPGSSTDEGHGPPGPAVGE